MTLPVTSKLQLRFGSTASAESLLYAYPEYRVQTEDVCVRVSVTRE